MIKKDECLQYLINEFQKIDSNSKVEDTGNGFYVECKEEKFIYDYNFNEHEVNEGNDDFWIYEENLDNTISIIGYKYPPTEEIIIPNFINGKIVKIISCEFKNNTNLKSMKISYGIEKIIGGLFSGCTNLTGKLNLPTSITYLGYGTFSNCINLKGDVDLNNVTYIGNHVFSHCTGLDGFLNMNDKGAIIGYMSFYNCNKLKGKAVISNFTSSADMTFHNCKSLEEVELKEGIESIPNRVFDNCSTLKLLKIPSSVKNIGVGSFRYCYGLKDLIIPVTIEKIDARAFECCSSLDCVITLSYNCIIEQNAFYDCGNLKINFIN